MAMILPFEEINRQRNWPALSWYVSNRGAAMVVSPFDAVGLNFDVAGRTTPTRVEGSSPGPVSGHTDIPMPGA
jgi:hypothetical protein